MGPILKSRLTIGSVLFVCQETGMERYERSEIH